MNVRVALVAGVLVGGIAGFVLGRLGNDPRGRASSNRNTSARDDAAVRTTRGPRATDGSALNGDAELRKEVETLRRRLARFEPEAGTDPDATNEEDLPPGTRRKNGTIVGGAEWTPMVRETALGFLDTMLKEFLKEANLHPDQEQRLRAEMDTRISEAMQISASFLNGDVTGDEAYERMGIMARDGRTMLGTVLDERQMEIYRKFERGTIDFIHTNVVSNELATLKSKLNLDSDQARTIQGLVSDRYKLVQERYTAPIPNIFFKPIRREADGEVYRASGAEIRQHLRPEQKAAFDKYEADANKSLENYRNLLVPRQQNK